MIAWLVFAVAFLAYANGANDNFKGVATLFGSRTTDYRKALWWATLTTFAGSCAAILFSSGLVKAFSGHGLVPDLLTQDPQFLLAVGIGAALTVTLATLTGFPISTTHALTGGLVGACLAAIGTVNAGRLSQSFFIPLAISPFLSFASTIILYPVCRFVRLRLGIERYMCLCIDGGVPQPVAVQPDGTTVLRSTGLSLSVGQLSACAERYQGHLLGVDSQWVLDRLHFLSAGAVSFARGLNDTPKIVALLIAARALRVPLSTGLMAIGLAMAAGGLLHAKKVARTMSERITTLNHGQGFTANLVTAVLVTLASQWGLPVSTTHVSCGSLFGLGTVNQSARWGVIRNILLSWLVTLPFAALCAAVIYRFA